MIQWNDLTIRQRTSQIQRFNILVDYLSESGAEEIAEIIGRIQNFNRRIGLLEQFIPGESRVIFIVSPQSADATVKLDGTEIGEDPTEPGRFISDELETGVHEVEITATGYETYTETFGINKTTTKEITLNPGEYTVELTVRPDEANPATVTFDGDVVSYVDGKYSIEDVQTGEHSIKIEKYGYVTYEDDSHYINYVGRKPVFTLLEDIPFDVTLSLGDEYEGIAVEFDGDEIEPDEDSKYIIEEVHTGQHIIDATCDDYFDYTTTIYFTKDYNWFTISLTPKEIPEVTIELAEDYEDVIVYFDGIEVVPTEDGYILEDVPAGKHMLECTAPKYYTYSEEVKVGTNSHEFTIELLPDVNIIFLTLTPTTGATPVVRCDKKVITATSPGYYRVIDVEEGDHEIVIEKYGYISYEDTVTVSDKETYVEVDMEEELQDVTLLLDEPYENPTIKFDGVEVLPDADNKYVIEDVQTGDHVITGTCVGYLDYEQTVVVNPASTEFIIDLVEPFTVVLNIDPAQGTKTVIFDGDLITPTLNKYIIEDVLPGNYTVKVKQNGYEDYEDEITVASGSTNFFIKLIKETFVTTIKTLPAARDTDVLYFDGVAHLPNSKHRYVIENVIEGDHTVYAAREGYETYNETIYFEDDGSIFEIDFVPITYDITLNVSPADGTEEVTFDGYDITTTTPGIYVRRYIEAGDYEVTISKAGYKDYTETITVSESSRVFNITLEVDPDQKFTLYIDTYPEATSSDKLFFDGVLQSTAGGRYGISNVVTGTHNITFMKDGYLTYNENIYCDPNNNMLTLTLEVDPRPKVDVKIKVSPSTSSSPATVYFDGTKINPNMFDPSTFFANQTSQGTHHLEVSKSGYVTYSEDIVVSDTQNQFTVTLQADVFTVTINLTDDHGKRELTFDGTEYTETKVSYNLYRYTIPNVSAGSHKVTVRTRSGSSSWMKRYDKTVNFTRDTNTLDIDTT